MNPPPFNPDYRPPVDALALPIVDGGNVSIVNIPKMSQAAFDFLKTQLDVYKAAIVRSESDGPEPTE